MSDALSQLAISDEGLPYEGVQAPARPGNAARSIFHITSALVSLAFLLVVFTPAQLPWVAGSIAGTFWVLEALRHPFPRFNVRLMRLFKPIAHASEAHRINSATWYMTALTLLALTRNAWIAAVGVAVLGFADPAASFVGRRWGKVELVHGRTLEGGLAFVVAGTVMAAVALQLATPRPGWGLAVAIAFVAALAGAVAEMMSRRLDDNFTIPLVSSATVAAILLALGRPLW
jgi:dolichol kinase